MTEREKLIEELENYFPRLSIGYIHDIADFIIEDRKRIVEPLIKVKQSPSANTDEWNNSYTGSAINNTLKLAGIE